MAIASQQEFESALDEMRLAGTDLAKYEVKAASGGVPKDIAKTVSAFANLDGGAIVLGVTEKGFHPAPEFDAKAAQAGLAQVARDQVVPSLMADIHVFELEGRPVVVGNIPEASPRFKPCYVQKQGQMRGSYIRTGDGDHNLSQYEIDRFIENQQRTARNDIATVLDSTLEDADENLLGRFIERLRVSSFGRTNQLDDIDLLMSRRVVAKDENGVVRLTVAGLMTFGKYPQSFFPRLNVVFTRYPSSRKGETDSVGMRFVDAATVEGNIPTMLANTIALVSGNMKHGAIVKGALREDIPDYPLAAVREAVANALMHRDYSAEGCSQPVMVDMYPDRLEIVNAGGLYGSLTVDRLGSRGATVSRNQFLSRILEDVTYTDYDGTTGHVVENRGSGLPTIEFELEKMLMGKPLISSSIDEFRIVMRHRKMTEEEGRAYSKGNTEEAILEFVRARGSASTSEIANAAGISTKTARRYVAGLCESGLLEGIGSRNSPHRRYRLGD